MAITFFFKSMHLNVINVQLYTMDTSSLVVHSTLQSEGNNNALSLASESPLFVTKTEPMDIADSMDTTESMETSSSGGSDSPPVTNRYGLVVRGVPVSESYEGGAYSNEYDQDMESNSENNEFAYVGDNSGYDSDSNVKADGGFPHKLLFDLDVQAGYDAIDGGYDDYFEIHDGLTGIAEAADRESVDDGSSDSDDNW